MRIAFLGLGRMGRELARHLLDEHDVTVWNRTAAAADGLVGEGARRAGSPAEAVDGADVVFTALFGADAVREVVVNARLPIPAEATWVDVTTLSPAQAREFAAWAAEHEVWYAHSPVVGSLAPARARALGVLLGGDPEAVRVAEPLVRLWAAPDRLRVYDSAALAAADKLVNNLALAVAMQGVVEALRLGRSAGLSPEQVLAALDGSMLTPTVKAKGEALRSAAYSDTQFSTDLLAKDSRLMLDTTRLPLPALTAAAAALLDASRRGHGDDDFSVIAADDAR
ncbi:NAD(P)-dependent oxidoreductase [Motilibacter deserti]|uniref:NAD(P)-dependent oxidoreductase n=1 Tax=Motilibacter deserti TaxID=2714956 RepID=A0ABX0GPB8_9ACTN|nr:NAD(P)-dependent oxidoreductase [Motilibacter deserti]NHC12688.1 NAD(P)-dependent oxidoreductase [Motilibacter deserti]